MKYVWVAILGIGLFATHATAQTIDLSANSYREIWRGEASSRAGDWLDRGELSNGDTRRDLIVGAPGWGTDRGRVYVVFSGPVNSGDNNLSGAAAIFTGERAGDLFGTSTAAGYVTGKEAALPPPLRDLAVGAPGAEAGKGVVYLFYGGQNNGARIAASSAQLKVIGQAGDALGTMLATGDMDGDGYREIIIGAPGTNRIYVVRGAPGISGTIDLAVTTPLMTITGPSGAGFGTVLAAGDLTGDGIYDLAVGVPDRAPAGAVYIVRGRATPAPTVALPANADAVLSGVDTGDRAGASIDIAAIDADLVGDLVIGAPSADGPSNVRVDGGEAYLLWGGSSFPSRSLSTAGVTFFGANPGDRLGADVATGEIDRLPPLDFALLAPDAGSAGEIHVLLGKARASFATTVDLATGGDRLVTGDPAAGRLHSVLIYDHTGEGADDIVGGIPTTNANTGSVYLSFSGVPARLTNPAKGSTINSSTVTLEWETGTRVSGYWLDVSVVRGGGELFSGYMGASRSYTVSNIPLSAGGTIWVRLRSYINGAYQIIDESYRTVTPVPARVTGPAVGSMISGSTQTFSWNSGTGVSAYWLDVGTSQGGNDIYQGYQGTSRSAAISGIPLTGGPVWVRLRSLINGSYQAVDHQFTTMTPTPSRVVSPAPGSTLGGSTATFAWDSGAGVSYYWVNVGVTQGDYSLYSGYVGTSRAVTVSNLPIDGRTIWVRLMSNINGSYRIVDHSFTAATAAPARITSPASGATLAGSAQMFSWSPGIGAAYYWVNVGTTPGDYSIYSGYVGTTTAVNVTGLPIDGSAVWVRLGSYINGAWQWVDHRFTAATPSPARITSPALGTQLGGATQMFSWSGGVGVSYYWVNVGRTQGGYEIYSNYVGNTTAVSLSGLPIDGSPVWVRLMSYINGGWRWIDHQYRAAVPGPARITMPAVGGTLSGDSQLFAWSEGVGASYYWVNVGTTQGGYELYSNYVGNTRAVTISNLPTNGGPIWVRLMSYINGGWQVVDHRFNAASPTPARITSPATGSTLSGSSQAFAWDNGVGVSYYWLNVGTTQGGYELYSGYMGTSHAATVTGLPTNGGEVWVRIYSRIGDRWEFVDHRFTAFQ